MIIAILISIAVLIAAIPVICCIYAGTVRDD